jgi:hypothetical protein
LYKVEIRVSGYGLTTSREEVIVTLQNTNHWSGDYLISNKVFIDTRGDTWTDEARTAVDRLVLEALGVQNVVNPVPTNVGCYGSNDYHRYDRISSLWCSDTHNGSDFTMVPEDAFTRRSALAVREVLCPIVSPGNSCDYDSISYQLFGDF